MTEHPTDLPDDAPAGRDARRHRLRGWTHELRAEFAAHAHDGRVGSRLLSATTASGCGRSGPLPASAATPTGTSWTTSGRRSTPAAAASTPRRHHPRGVVLRG